MTTYAAALAAPVKAPVWIAEFPDHGPQRYVSSRLYTGLTSAALPGMEPGGVLSAALNLRTNRLDFDDVQFMIRDSDGAVATFLSANDATLRGAAVTLKYGFDDVAEADFQTIALYLDDWERVTAGFRLRLRTALAYLDRPLYEDFGKDDFTLRSSLTAATMTIDVQGDCTTAKWRTAGHVLLSDSQTGEVELVEYSSFSVVADNHTVLTVAERRKFECGSSGKTWGASTTRVQQAWAYGSIDPLGLFLVMATTTDSVGANGTEDVGTGDGLGDLVPAAALDRAGILALRSYFFDPLGTSLNALYIGTEPISSVLEMFETEFLAMGLRFKLTRAGKLSLFRLGSLVTTTPTVLTGKVIEGNIPTWKRDYSAVENNAVWRWDFNPSTNNYAARQEEISQRSIDRYGRSRLREVKAIGLRGLAGAGYGFPDLGWDVFMERDANAYVVEFANPSANIEVDGFLSAQDFEVGDLVTLTHPAIYDLDAGVMGVTAKAFYVVGIERRPNEARIGLTLRQRRNVSTQSRLFIIAPASIADYASATDAEKQYGYIAPAAGDFADGGAPYEIGD